MRPRAKSKGEKNEAASAEASLAEITTPSAKRMSITSQAMERELPERIAKKGKCQNAHEYCFQQHFTPTIQVLYEIYSAAYK
jgi:hypothetical protein